MENSFLRDIRSLFASDDASVITGSGPDDCAHLALGAERLAVSVDAFAEGSHFLASDPAELVGGKAMAASLSDLAASGCRPRWALVSACFRKGLGGEWALRFAEGLAETAKRYGVTVVGGDTVSTPGGTSVSVTVVGTPFPGGPVLRSTARAGDVVVVTGALGGSGLGRHLRPEPRLAEMRELLAFFAGRPDGNAAVGAAMDISDGLALDLSRLCAESGVGAAIEADSLPLSPDALRMSERSGKSALDHALSDGEDFELLLTLAPAAWNEFRLHLDTADVAKQLAPFSRIGVVTDDRRLSLIDSDGRAGPLAAKGYEHQW